MAYDEARIAGFVESSRRKWVVPLPAMVNDAECVRNGRKLDKILRILAGLPELSQQKKRTTNHKKK